MQVVGIVSDVVVMNGHVHVIGRARSVPVVVRRVIVCVVVG